MPRTFARLFAATALLGAVACASQPAFASVTPNTLPTVSMISPNSGPIVGGTAITITGTGFVTGTKVVIGQGQGAPPVTATNVKVVSAKEITATTPTSAAVGIFHLHVITPSGTSPDGVGSRFTYLGPVVSAVTPNTGPVAGGTRITITGTGFMAHATVEITQGGKNSPIMATNVQVISSTEIKAITGGGAKTGTFHVRVTTTQGTSAENPKDRFTYK